MTRKANGSANRWLGAAYRIVAASVSHFHGASTALPGCRDGSQFCVALVSKPRQLFVFSELDVLYLVGFTFG